MRIAQVSPLFESVPPRYYGGTERIVHELTEALIRRGHKLTLFASGDSQTSAELIAATDESLRLKGAQETTAPHFRMFEMLRREADRFDLIHFHTEFFHLPMIRSLSVPTVTTLHGRLDVPEYEGLFEEFRDLNWISISESQRSPKPRLSWVATVQHGLDPKRIAFSPGAGDDLVFLGRVSPEKGFHLAVEIARRAGRRLRVAAKMDKADSEYIKKVYHLLKEPFVEFLGEISEDEKSEFLGGAAALLFPIQWPEPFGLVMIEALAAGTPVIAFRNGSVSEVIRHGQTGFVVNSVDEAVRSVVDISSINRSSCRHEFEQRFTADAMADRYCSVYEEVLRPKGTDSSFGLSLRSRRRSLEPVGQRLSVEGSSVTDEPMMREGPEVEDVTEVTEAAAAAAAAAASVPASLARDAARHSLCD